MTDSVDTESRRNGGVSRFGPVAPAPDRVSRRMARSDRPSQNLSDATTGSADLFAGGAMAAIESEVDLAIIARALADSCAPGRSSAAKDEASRAAADGSLLRSLRASIAAGEDPLGDAFCRLRPPAERRSSGAVYTPAPIVDRMVAWAAQQADPVRIVDPGCGSGRFVIAAARRFPAAQLIAVDCDPLALLMLRANVAVLGLAERMRILCGDYRDLVLPAADGPTLFIGNPPYLRHHNLSRAGKVWFAAKAAAFGFKASNLAGLHIHFFLKTRELGRNGDFGVFITSAEWLDVNYGSVLRKMLVDGLGGSALHVLDARANPFAGAATTAAIACFQIGRRPDHVVVQAVDSLDRLDLAKGRAVERKTLANAPRWNVIVKPAAAVPKGHIELGELFRVHRGQVTGGNGVWIEGRYPADLPKAILFPSITKARELLEAGPALDATANLRRVIDLPADLGVLGSPDRECVDRFLEWARAQGAHESFIARTRKAWWAVNLRAPAPILCTYMARRPPAFVRNLCGARHINIAHGLYPREPLGEEHLRALVAYLSGNAPIQFGRTYAGGLTKFEPKEIERLPIPDLDSLHGLA